MRKIEIEEKQEELIKKQMKTISKLQDVINLQKFDLIEERKKLREANQKNEVRKKNLRIIRNEIRAFMKDDDMKHLKTCLMYVRRENNE